MSDRSKTTVIDDASRLNERIAKIEDEACLNLQEHLKAAIKIAIIEAQGDAASRAYQESCATTQDILHSFKKDVLDIIEGKP